MLLIIEILIIIIMFSFYSLFHAVRAKKKKKYQVLFSVIALIVIATIICVGVILKCGRNPLTYSMPLTVSGLLVGLGIVILNACLAIHFQNNQEDINARLAYHASNNHKKANFIRKLIGHHKFMTILICNLLIPLSTVTFFTIKKLIVLQAHHMALVNVFKLPIRTFEPFVCGISTRYTSIFSLVVSLLLFFYTCKSKAKNSKKYEFLAIISVIICYIIWAFSDRALGIHMW